jgi:anti-sigma factor RsiW
MAELAADRRALCPQTTLTAAYLDGELTAAAAEEFERHTRACPPCSDSLLEQRRLLCLLDTAFDGIFEKKVELPDGFTRQVKARAQNDMRGMRARDERRRALKICAALGASAFALLGFTILDAFVAPVLSAARAAGGMLGMAGRATSDAGAGAGVVVRALGGRLVGGSGMLGLSVLLTAGFVLLLRLISGYHRAGARD